MLILLNENILCLSLVLDWAQECSYHRVGVPPIVLLGVTNWGYKRFPLIQHNEIGNLDLDRISIIGSNSKNTILNLRK